MSLVELNLKPSDRQLRQFGAICIVALPAVTWFWSGNPTAVSWAAAVGVLICVLSLVLPRAVKPVFLALVIATLPIGFVVGELAMLIIYFGMFLPMSIVFRIIGRDSLQRRSKVATESYWQKRSPVRSIRNYYRQS